MELKKTILNIKSLFKKPQALTKDISAEIFWTWFKKNQNKFLFLSDIDEEVKESLMNEFLGELHKFNENVYFEIGGHKDDEKVELIISAEGNLDFFPAVEKLTNSAPTLKNWEIIAFKPPMGKGFSMDFRGKVFDPKKIIYIPLNSKSDPKSIGFNVCYPDFDITEEEIYITGTYLILDTILGEKSAAIDIDYMEVIKTPEDIANYNFGHLADIAEYISEKKNVC